MLNSWLLSERDVGRNKLMSQDVYYAGFRDECVTKLDQGFVLVACNPDDEDQIFGWVCASTDGVLHFVYVKAAFRGYGVAGALVREAVPSWTQGPTVVSTAGRSHREWARRYNLTYDPFSWKKSK